MHGELTSIVSEGIVKKASRTAAENSMHYMNHPLILVESATSSEDIFGLAYTQLS